MAIFVEVQSTIDRAREGLEGREIVGAFTMFAEKIY